MNTETSTPETVDQTSVPRVVEAWQQAQQTINDQQFHRWGWVPAYVLATHTQVG